MTPILRISSERGSLAVFMALGLTAFLGVAAVAVDVGYMYKARREMQVAADSGALAGVRELASHDTAAARTKAVQFATANKLAGGSVSLDATNDVAFGKWTGTSFVQNGTPTNAIKVTVRKTSGTTQGPLALLFAPALGIQTQQLTTSSIAILSGVDLMMVLDWSTSMVNGTTWTKCTKCLQGQTPASRSPWCGTYNTTTNYCSCGTTSSGVMPFDTLQVSAASFVTDFDSQFDQIGVETFYNTATSPIDQTLTASFSSVTSKITGLADPTNCSMTTHSTNIADGMAKGIAELQSVRARVSATKVMVLISDGQPTCTEAGSCSTSSSTITSGRNSALSRADSAATAGIIIHTIGLGPDTDVSLMTQIAQKTGGTYYYAATGGDLSSVFASIRKRIPVQLVQ